MLRSPRHECTLMMMMTMMITGMMIVMILSRMTQLTLLTNLRCQDRCRKVL